jgi:glycerol-3-phosphate acyltransferase PlsY
LDILESLQILGYGLLAYLLGSVPTAVLVSRGFFGIDIREHGSGNAGATNTFRVLGKKYGIIVMFIDIIKGFTAANFALFTGDHFYGEVRFINLQLFFGIMSVIGHIFPVYIGFKGGKGVATLFGMILAIHLPAALVCVVIFAFTLFTTRYVSLSSMLAAVMLPLSILFIFHNQERWLILFGICIALMVILTHRKNITRLLEGNENKANILKKHKKRSPRNPFEN